jgi:hypothetical protein
VRQSLIPRLRETLANDLSRWSSVLLFCRLLMLQVPLAFEVPDGAPQSEFCHQKSFSPGDEFKAAFPLAMR